MREDLRRIGEHDADFVRLKLRTVRQLVRSVGQLVGALRRGGGDATATHQAVSDFLARHIGILQAAYEAGHREGAKDYYGAVSARSARYAATVKPDRQVTQKRMAFYALPSVTRMAVEAQSALHATHLARVVTAHDAGVSQTQRAVGLREMPLTEAEAHELEDWITHPRALPTWPPRALPLSDRDMVRRFGGEDAGGSTGDALAQWQESLGARITLQADVVWSGLQDGYTDAGGGDPAYGYYSLIYWMLEPLATHCDDCLAMAADSPYNAPGLGGNTLYTTPGDGSTECGAACKCSLSYDAPGQIQDRLNDALAEALARAGQGDLATQLNAARAQMAPLHPQPSGPVGPEGEQLSEGQKGALDAYREASDAWDLVRDNLPSFRDILSGELHDAPVLAEGTELTPEQARVVEQLVDALVRFADEGETSAESEAALRDDLAQAQARLEAAQQKVDDINARLAARPSNDFISREEMHAANVEYVTAQQAVEDAAASLERMTGEAAESVSRVVGFGNRAITASYDLTTDDQAFVQTIKSKIAQLDQANLTPNDVIDIGRQINARIEADIADYRAFADEATIALQNIGGGTATDAERQWALGDAQQVQLHRGVSPFQARAQYQAEFQARVAAYLDEIRPVGGVDVQLDTSAANFDQQVADALQAVRDLIPRDWLDASNSLGGDITPIRLRASDVNRDGYFLPDRSGSGAAEIAMKYSRNINPIDVDSTALHEMMHRMEQAVPQLSNLEADFYEARTFNEMVTRLQTGRGFTKLDNWQDEYLGRVPIPQPRPVFGVPGSYRYATYSYELLSVGAEMLLGGGFTYDLVSLREDEEYVAFILGLFAAVGAGGAP